MSLTVPGLGEIPIVWMPSADFWEGRFGRQPIAIVHHRAVASTLDSIDTTMLDSSRSVSCHFGIGNVRGRGLEVHQYVNLSDSAWTNGDYDPSGKWDEWFGAPQPLPNGFLDVNARTITIEHDDNGGAPKGDPKRGIVTENIVKISIALDRLMLSGDRQAMRQAGIRIRDDGTAEALAAIPIDGRHLIDHKNIAGKNKTYCWRPWAADQEGFPRARYVQELQRPGETACPEPAELIEPYTDRIAELEAAIASDAQTAAAVAAVLRDAAEELDGR